MSTTLSQRFSQLSQTRKPQTQAKVNVRVEQKNQDQRSRRQDLTQQRRGIAPTNDKKRPDKKILPRVKIGNVKKGGRPAERRQGKNGKGKGKPDKKKENVTPMDLDMEMDKYWFAAGKGPNPVVASLDRDMDDYFKSKKETST